VTAHRLGRNGLGQRGYPAGPFRSDLTSHREPKPDYGQGDDGSDGTKPPHAARMHRGSTF
jgi:hypothetical protein